MCGVTGLLRYGTLTLVSAPYCNEQWRLWHAREEEQHKKCHGACAAAIAAWDSEHGQ